MRAVSSSLTSGGSGVGVGATTVADVGAGADVIIVGLNVGVIVASSFPDRAFFLG